jgi:ubiquitin C-terminal hydrolase
MTTEEEPRGLLGLANLGNTCYMNSVLQALRNNKEWTLFCLKDHVKPFITEKDTQPKKILLAYIELLQSLWGGKGPGYVMPKGFFDKLKEVVQGGIYEDFIRRTPQDAHEFLVWLLDQMYMATQSEQKMTLVSEEKIEPMIRQALKGWIGAFEKQYSPLTDLVFGMYRIQYQCQSCKTIHTRWETFNTLKYTPLAGQDGKPLDLLECLKQEFQEESIDEYACDTCAPARAPAKKTVCIWRLPKCLILTAKRFSPTGHKIHTPVAEFMEPTKFFGLFAPESHEPSKHIAYDLFATVDHHGSHFGGHYTAQAKSILTGKWGHYDDETHMPIGAPSVGRTTYMMFLNQI